MRGLSMNLAIDMLRHHKEYISSINKDWHPKEGQVYVFDLDKVGQMWKHDGYEWKNNGSTVQPKANPTLKKVFFLVRSADMYSGDRRFQKIVYSLRNRPNIIMIHYMGDSNIEMAISKRKRRSMEAQKGRKVKEDMDLRARGLTLDETVEILENYEQHLSRGRAVHPQGGEMYVFDRNMIGEDWKCDGYIWRNSGTRYMPSKNPVIRKNFYFIRTKDSGEKGSREFKKSACFLLKRPNIILVHYMGDEKVFTPRKHGNRKKGDVIFERTCPSVIEAIKSTIVQENPHDTFQRLLSSGGEKPRDIKQLQSLKERLTRSTRQPRKKRKYVTEQEAPEVVEFDPGNMVQVEVYNPDDSMNSMDIVDTNQITDENIQPLLMEPLHTHPEIRKVQLEILRQQQRNLDLQNEKFQLEIEKLKRNKKIQAGFQAQITQPLTRVTQPEEAQVVQYVDESQAAAIADLDEPNVIYVNSESDLLKLTQGMYVEGDGEQQYVYIQEGAVPMGEDVVDQSNVVVQSYVQ